MTSRSTLRPSRFAPGYSWLKGHPPITAEGSQRLFLHAETWLREQNHLSEKYSLTGIYVGPRVLWARFDFLGGNPKGAVLELKAERSRFDAWEAAR